MTDPAPSRISVSQLLARKNWERRLGHLAGQLDPQPNPEVEMPPPLNPHAQEEVSDGGDVLHERFGCIVKRYPDGAVIKSGRDVQLDERAALDLAAQLDLPVPHVYEASQDPSSRVVRIRMDFIEGKRLDVLWPNMTEDEKQAVCRQLREILTTMRSAPWTAGVIGSCAGGRVRDCRRIGHYEGGPFSNQANFNDFYADFPSSIPQPLRRAISRGLCTNHRVVFSHGDLSQHNIMVKDGRITGLVDWEFAGWYPEFWDYVKFFDRPASAPERDWKDRADDIFPQVYDAELALYHAIMRWQRP